MAKLIKDINIFLGGELRTRDDLAIALRMIADAVEKGATNGYCGWSTVNFDIIEDEEEEDDER